MLIREREDDVIRLLGKQGKWIVQLSSGIDNRKVTPYRAEDAKSIGREVTFQEDVMDWEFLKDVLFLLSLCVEHRAKQVGLYGKGVSLKITYANMKGITRSHAMEYCDSAIQIYKEAVDLFDQVEDLPVRLIGVSIYNLSGEVYRQLTFEDYLEDVAVKKEEMMDKEFTLLQERYGLDFAGHLEQIYHGMTLHKTIEYMRKKSGDDAS